MAFNRKYLKSSGVKRNDTLGAGDRLDCKTHRFYSTPECKLKFRSCVPENLGFSCTGGVL